MRKKLFGIIGNPVTHSLSPVLHNYWFNKYSNLIKNHNSSININDLEITDEEFDEIEGRYVIAKKLQALPVESIVRSYLIGSGYSDYLSKGSVCNLELPKNLKMASKLPNLIYTPSSKAEVGDHDVNISFQEMSELIGSELSEKVKNTSIEIFKSAEEHLGKCKIILADTKFEFGLSKNGDLILMDELLTSDSSRFWLSESYQEGISPPSLDKQFIRDYVKSISWNDTMPAPELPDDIVIKTSEKYEDLRKILMD